MCVLAFAWQAHPRWPLVMIGNRDELHAREAAALAHWEDAPHVLAGRDLEAGGTWLGVSDQGRFAVVTNMPNPEGPQPGMASRGALVADVLSGTGDYRQPQIASAGAFNPFNLIWVENGKARYLANRPAPTEQPLEAGVHGVSNSPLDEPWPKTERIKTMLGEWLKADTGAFDGLLDRLRADDSPQVEPGQARISPIFIRNAVYGTRCSTVVAVDANGSGTIVERRYDANGHANGETALQFNWPI